MTLYTKYEGDIKKVGGVYTKYQGEIKKVGKIFTKYQGELRLVYQDVITLVLASSTQVNVASLLAANNISEKSDVIVSVPSGVIIGGTVAGGVALAMGDIRPWGNVTLQVAGKIYGCGGTSTNPKGGGAIYSWLPFSLDVLAGGEVKGGGGGGGNGAFGQAGIFVDGWQEDYEDGDCYNQMNRWDDDACGGSGEVARWCNGGVGFPCGDLYMKNDSTKGGIGKIFTKGLINQGGGLFSIRRGNYKQFVGGAFGAGGNGQGYNQAKSNGLAGGVAGNDYSGDGGDGGAGGLWAANGSTGSDGGSSTVFSTPVSAYTAGGFRMNTTTQAGAKGNAGGAGGYAVYADNIDVYYRNNGDVAGDTTFTHKGWI